ncbi:hypothetical protein VNO77_34513 [Canavalia gladiata]|uniref:Uncharacterized protein n=1 Tax=Canavalia gladiata TaxID=3824 RepID=A0AAN9KFN0_CANGL
MQRLSPLFSMETRGTKVQHLGKPVLQGHSRLGTKQLRELVISMKEVVTRRFNKSMYITHQVNDNCHAPVICPCKSTRDQETGRVMHKPYSFRLVRLLSTLVMSVGVARPSEREHHVGSKGPCEH